MVLDYWFYANVHAILFPLSGFASLSPAFFTLRHLTSFADIMFKNAGELQFHFYSTAFLKMMFHVRRSLGEGGQTERKLKNAGDN